MDHALVVGATGMLRGVVEWLDDHGWHIIALARRSQRLAELAATSGAGQITPLAVDYCRSEKLRDAVDEVQQARGPIGLVIAWIHGTAPDGHDIVAGCVGRQPPITNYFEILGSASANPSTLELERADRLAQLPHLDHHRVVLGYGAQGQRWLTDAEISTGVVAAVERGASEFVAGTLEPYEGRPS